MTKNIKVHVHNPLVREKNLLEGTYSLKKLFTNMPSGVTFGHKEMCRTADKFNLIIFNRDRNLPQALSPSLTTERHCELEKSYEKMVFFFFFCHLKQLT